MLASLCHSRYPDSTKSSVTLDDWMERINFSCSLMKGDDQLTVHLDRKMKLLFNDHLTVRGTVIEACTELTIKAGAGFIKIDPSGVYIVSAQ